ETCYNRSAAIVAGLAVDPARRRWTMRKALAYVATGLLAALAVSAAQAQMKFNGKMQCTKPDVSHSAEVGDAPGHTLSLLAQKCTWASGDMGGDAVKTNTDTFTSDASGNLSHEVGYAVTTGASGDQSFVSWKGSTTLKDGAPVSG